MKSRAQVSLLYLLKLYYTILNSELYDLIKDRCMIFSLEYNQLYDLKILKNFFSRI